MLVFKIRFEDGEGEALREGSSRWALGWGRDEIGGDGDGMAGGS